VFSSIFPAEAKESALCAGSTGIGNHLINLLPVAGLLFLLLTGVISHPLCPPLHLTKLIHSSLLSVYILYSHSHPFHFLPPWAHLIAAIDEFNCANYCADFVPQRCCLVPFPRSIWNCGCSRGARLIGLRPCLCGWNKATGERV